MRNPSLARQRETLPRSRWVWQHGEKSGGVVILKRVRAERPSRDRYEVMYECCREVRVITQRQLVLRWVGLKGELCHACASRRANAEKKAPSMDDEEVLRVCGAFSGMSAQEWRLFQLWESKSFPTLGRAR